MGAQVEVTRRVVFDTNTVVSALLFVRGRLAWLREHWQCGDCTPLVSRETAAELQRVLKYPKFSLTPDEILDVMGDYLPFCEIVEQIKTSPQRCRDRHDQAFLDLACSADSDALVTGDVDQLALAGATRFAIVSGEAYRQSCEK